MHGKRCQNQGPGTPQPVAAFNFGTHKGNGFPYAGSIKKNSTGGIYVFLFSEFATLQYQNKAMRQELEAFRNGERYKRLQADHHKVAAGYIKEINRLKKELAKAHAAIVTVRNIWFEECDSAWENIRLN